MDTNELVWLLENRRSVRKFTDETIAEEKVDIMMHAVMTSPTARNLQPWKFAVVRDKKMLGSLSVLKEGGAAMIKDAPLAVVIMGNESVSSKWIEDGSIAATILQLTAESLGLGSCWVQVRGAEYDRSFSSEQYVRQLLGEKSDMRVLCVIALGYDAVERTERDWPRIEDKVVFY